MSDQPVTHPPDEATKKAAWHQGETHHLAALLKESAKLFVCKPNHALTPNFYDVVPNEKAILGSRGVYSNGSNGSSLDLDSESASRILVKHHTPANGSVSHRHNNVVHWSTPKPAMDGV